MLKSLNLFRGVTNKSKNDAAMDGHDAMHLAQGPNNFVHGDMHAVLHHHTDKRSSAVDDTFGLTLSSSLVDNSGRYSNVSKTPRDSFDKSSHSFERLGSGSIQRVRMTDTPEESSFRVKLLSEDLGVLRDKFGYYHEDEDDKPPPPPAAEEMVITDDGRDYGTPEPGARGRSKSIIADILATLDHKKTPSSVGFEGTGTAASSVSVVPLSEAALITLRYHQEQINTAMGSRFDQKTGAFTTVQPSTAGSKESVVLREAAEVQEAKRTVTKVYKAVLGRPVDVAGLKHYTHCITEEGMDRDALVIKLLQSQEYMQKKFDEHAGLAERYRIVWHNKIYPWIAEEDEPDEDPGTLRWEENPEMENQRMWISGNVKGNNRGMEVFEGKLVYSTMDCWNTACTKTGFSTGVHWWSVTKFLRGLAGEKGRLGVIVKGAELDTDLKATPYFKDRAFFMGEDGSLWNGDTFVTNGVPYYAAGSVVTMKLDTYAKEMSFWVASKGPVGHQQALYGDDMGIFCGTIKIPPHAVELELFPFVQDMYGGSGWSFSPFETEGPEELAHRQLWQAHEALDKQRKMGVSKRRAWAGGIQEPPAETRPGSKSSSSKVAGSLKAPARGGASAHPKVSEFTQGVLRRNSDATGGGVAGPFAPMVQAALSGVGSFRSASHAQASSPSGSGRSSQERMGVGSPLGSLKPRLPRMSSMRVAGEPVAAEHVQLSSPMGQSQPKLNWGESNKWGSSGKFAASVIHSQNTEIRSNKHFKMSIGAQSTGSGKNLFSSSSGNVFSSMSSTRSGSSKRMDDVSVASNNPAVRPGIFKRMVSRAAAEVASSRLERISSGEISHH